MNSIEYAAVFQQELDTAMIADSTTGWMEANADMAKYMGGRTIKIPKISLDGMANYDRASGYVDGDVTLEWEVMTMTQDRGRAFMLDAMDVDESNLALAAGKVMGEFQRVKVAPEIDAYRISKIFTLADGRKRTYTPAAASILKELKTDIATVQDKIGDGEELVVMISIPVASILDMNDSIAKHLAVQDFRKGEAYVKVTALDGIPLLRIPSARMKSGFVFYDGVTAGDESAPDQRPGGFAPAADAVDINWIVCAKSAPIGVSKTDTIRVFNPTSYQKANAWRIDYRRYHDLWIPENKLDSVYVNRAGS